jgi:hypothetical protein
MARRVRVCKQEQPVGGVAFGLVEDTAARKLVMQWEHAASEWTRVCFS